MPHISPERLQAKITRVIRLRDSSIAYEFIRAHPGLNTDQLFQIFDGLADYLGATAVDGILTHKSCTKGLFDSVFEYFMEQLEAGAASYPVVAYGSLIPSHFLDSSQLIRVQSAAKDFKFRDPWIAKRIFSDCFVAVVNRPELLFCDEMNEMRDGAVVRRSVFLGLMGLQEVV